MEEHKLEKNLVFFNPGESGTVFTYQTGNLINDQIIQQTIDHLEYDTANKIDCVEERRAKPRTILQM